jgi:MFS transporter, OFA family, oxalate/formate antiporter
LDPLKAGLGWEAADVKWAFSLAIVFLGLSAAFLGPWIQKIGPRAAGRLCAVLYGLGIVGAGLAVHLHSLPLFYLTYGVVGGVGLGIGYLAPIPTLVRWFPDKKGVGTGICVMGFGLAALVFGPLMKSMFETTGIAQTLMILGAVYFVLILANAQYLENPPEGWAPAVAKGTQKVAVVDVPERTLGQAARMPQFYLIWGMFFLNILCGISLISVAAKMGKEFMHMDAATAAALVGLLGLFNGVGRFFWAAVSDKIGRAWTYRAFYIVQMVLIGYLWNLSRTGGIETLSVWTFEAILCLWITCYGGGFAALPAFLGETFGKTHLASIQGVTLTAWSAAGLIGPWLIVSLHDRQGSYAAVFPYFIGFLGLALILSIALGLLNRSLEAKKAV